ncbi:MAG: pyridoxine 5'-phosphate synthase [Fibrobacteria bacterium]|nr:pyridoxine 5'-phosphate synthase [Fibrobacteria bacterium]
MPKLSVNVDHIATIREARKCREPDPVAAAVLAELAGANGITVHLREDRRHIQERDVKILRQTISTKLNLEMAPTPEMVQFAIDSLPDMVTLVPESREELTTEGGLNVAAKVNELEKVTSSLKIHHIYVSCFIDPEIEQIKAAKKAGASCVEFHTGSYCNAFDYGEDDMAWQMELDKIEKMAQMAVKSGLEVNAGHGLNYQNVHYIAAIPEIQELSIGHSIISRASLLGMNQSVKDMLGILEKTTSQASTVI